MFHKKQEPEVVDKPPRPLREVVAEIVELTAERDKLEGVHRIWEEYNHKLTHSLADLQETLKEGEAVVIGNYVYGMVNKYYGTMTMWQHASLERFDIKGG